MTINTELRPRIEALRKDLIDYRSSIEIHSKGSVIERFERLLTEDLYTLDEEPEDDRLLFNPKAHYTKQFRKDFDKLLDSIMKDCNFSNYSDCYFDLTALDIVVNGKKKKKYGKGYRAFLNSVLANAILRCLTVFGEISPKLLLIDSPILSLKENKDNARDVEISNNMRSSLFKYMVDNQKYGQTIIIENDIPKIDYKDAKIIYFTHDPENGRYGLLYGVTD